MAPGGRYCCLLFMSYRRTSQNSEKLSMVSCPVAEASCRVVGPRVSGQCLGHHPVLFPPALWVTQPLCALYSAKWQGNFAKRWEVCANVSPNADPKFVWFGSLLAQCPWSTHKEGRASKGREIRSHIKCSTRMLFCHVPTSCMTLVDPLFFLGLSDIGMGSPDSRILLSTPSFPSFSVLRMEARALRHLSTCSTVELHLQSFSSCVKWFQKKWLLNNFLFFFKRNECMHYVRFQSNMTIIIIIISDSI